MRGRRGTDGRGLLAVLLGVACVGLSSPCWAAEFYSWIDASGTMVMTDDLSLVPPATHRSDVSVHRFLDRPPGPSVSRRSPDPDQQAGATAQAAPGQPGQIAAADLATSLPVDPVALDLPNVLLDSPDETIQDKYVWVPLLSPIYLGTSPVPGFWCLRTVADPGLALKDFVRRHQGQVVVGGRPWHYGPVGVLPYNARSARGHFYRWGNPAGNQAMRGQQFLNGRVNAHGQPTQAAGSIVVGQGHQSGRR